MQDAGLTVMPTYPFGCECGRSGCRATWMATPDDYAARTASERQLIAHDTLGSRNRRHGGRSHPLQVRRGLATICRTVRVRLR